MDIDDDMVERARGHLHMTLKGYGIGEYSHEIDPHPAQVRRALEAALNEPECDHDWIAREGNSNWTLEVCEKCKARRYVEPEIPVSEGMLNVARPIAQEFFDSYRCRIPGDAAEVSKQIYGAMVRQKIKEESGE